MWKMTFDIFTKSLRFQMHAIWNAAEATPTKLKTSLFARQTMTITIL